MGSFLRLLLKGLLRTDTDEKDALWSQLEEKKKCAKYVEKAVGIALEVGEEYERKQLKLVEDSQTLANKFELVTIQVAAIKKESVSEEVDLAAFLDRVNGYLTERDTLLDEMQGVAHDAARLQEKMRARNENRNVAVTAESLDALAKENAETEETLKVLNGFDMAAEEETLTQKQSRMERLSKETAELQGTDLDKKRADLDGRIAELDERGRAGQAEAHKVLAALKATSDASTERMTALEGKLRDQKDVLDAATKASDDAAAALVVAQLKEQSTRETAAQHVVDEGRADAAFKEAEDALSDAKKREHAVRQQIEAIAREQVGKDSDEAAALAPGPADDDLDPDALQRQVDDLQSTAATMDCDITALTTALAGDETAGAGAGDDDAGGASSELRAVVAELDGLRARVETARKEADEHRRTQAELQGEAAGAAQQREDAQRTRDALAAEHAALEKDVEALLTSVQTAAERLTAAQASPSASGVDGQDVCALERRRDEMEAAAVRAEEDAAAPTDLAQQADLDAAHARRYIADQLALTKQQVHAMAEEIKVADSAFQKRMSDAQRRFKEEQAALTNETRELERAQVLAERLCHEATEDVRNMAGGVAALALMEVDAEDDEGEEETRRGGASQGERSAGGARTTPTAVGSWGMSKPAEINSGFRSGVEGLPGSGVGQIHGFSLTQGAGSGRSEEAEELLRAQHAHSSAAHASAPTTGAMAGKGRVRGGGGAVRPAAFGLGPGPLPGPLTGASGDGTAVAPQTRKARAQGRN